MKIRKSTLEKLKLKSEELKINYNILIKLREYFGSFNFLTKLMNIKKSYNKYDKNKKFPNSFEELKIFLEKIYEFRNNNDAKINLEYFLLIGLSEKEYKKYCSAKTKKMIEMPTFTNTLEEYNEKYGEEEGRKRYEKRRKDCGKSVRLEYWLERGYTEEEAKQKLKERQATGKLENFMKRYGPVQGYIKWYKRQKKWQNTLNSKSPEEIEEINKKRNPYLKYDYETKEEYFNRARNYIINNKGYLQPHYKDIHTYITYHIENYKNSFDSIKYSPEEYFENHKILKNLIDKNEFINRTKKFHKKDINYKKTLKGTLIFYDNYTFRSYFEFYFYLKLKENIIDFIYEKNYPNSKLKFDFYLPKYDIYIEIAGLMNEKEYREKMKYKKEKFGSIILENREDVDNFFVNLQL